MKLSDIVKISVCTCCDRRAKEINYIKNICKIIGLEVKIFIGGNGKNEDLQYDYIDTEYELTDINKCYINQYNFHKVAIKWAYEQNFDHVLFLEDDITLTKDFWEVLSKVDVPEDYDQINIGGMDNNLNLLNNYDTNSIHNPHLLVSTWPGGFFGSIVNGKNLKYLYEQKHFDGLPGPQNPSNTKFIHYMLQPPVVVERNMISIVQNVQFPRGIHQQALDEGRLFTDEEIYDEKCLDNASSVVWNPRKIVHITSNEEYSAIRAG